MTEPLLASWESFYVIVGSSAAALTGLQFVVITLAADKGVSSDTTSSFATPTVMHLAAVLLISAILSAPWHGTGWPIALVALAGASGCVYMVLVVRAARRQHRYQPVLEDIVWHWCLPFVAYGSLAVCGLFARHAEGTLFAVAWVALLLLFVGIHNAWDSAVFTAARRREKD